MSWSIVGNSFEDGRYGRLMRRVGQICQEGAISHEASSLAQRGAAISDARLRASRHREGRRSVVKNARAREEVHTVGSIKISHTKGQTRFEGLTRSRDHPCWCELAKCGVGRRGKGEVRVNVSSPLLCVPLLAFEVGSRECVSGRVRRYAKQGMS